MPPSLVLQPPLVGSTPRSKTVVGESSQAAASSSLNPAASPFSLLASRGGEAGDELSEWLLFSPSSSVGPSLTHGDGHSASPCPSYADVVHRKGKAPLEDNPHSGGNVVAPSRFMANARRGQQAPQPAHLLKVQDRQFAPRGRVEGGHTPQAMAQGHPPPPPP
jgi:hypothetical protein